MNNWLKNNMTVISVAVFIAFWWFLLGSVELAIALGVLIFVHEMGHFIAARHRGLAVYPPVFTPFGAAVAHSQPPSAECEAFVSYAGPLFGAAASVAALVLGLVLNVPMLFMAAKYGFFLNLINLIPMKPLDGGGISMGIHRYMWVPGVLMFFWLFTAIGNSMFNMIILVLILMGFFQDMEYRKTLPASYFNVPFAARIGYGVAYIALGAFLFWAFTQPQALVSLLVGVGI